MRGVDRYGGDIATIDHVSNHSECSEHCIRRHDCSIWTYLGGICYIKSENTFRTINPNAVAGIKNCQSNKTEGMYKDTFMLNGTENIEYIFNLSNFVNDFYLNIW